MPKTLNLNLELIADDDIPIDNWWPAINGDGAGENKSNMQLIDDFAGSTVTINGVTKAVKDNPVFTVEGGSGGGSGESIYDIVVRTQAEFVALYTRWDAGTAVTEKSVAFIGDGGTLKFTRSDGKGIRIPQTVRQVHGFNNAIIEINAFAYAATTNEALLWYTTKPAARDYTIKDLTINCTAGAKPINGFIRCVNLINCTCAVPSGTGSLAAYSNCDYLVNCSASGKGTGDAIVAMFQNCNYLVNCAGNTAAGGNLTKTYAFYYCNQLLNCDGSSAGASSNDVYAFYYCNRLTNCVGTSNNPSTSSGASYVFYQCAQLTNCTGTANSMNTSAYAFFSCTLLTDCIGTGAFSSTSASSSMNAGFYYCTQLTNCTGTTTGTVGNGYGFNNCTQLLNCTGSGKGAIGYAFGDCKYLNGCKESTTLSKTDIWTGTNLWRDDNSCQLTRSDAGTRP